MLFIIRVDLLDVIREVNFLLFDNLGSLILSQNLLQFLPATLLKDVPQKKIPELLYLMKLKAKTVSKRSIASVLGCVGEKAFGQLARAKVDFG